MKISIARYAYSHHTSRNETLQVFPKEKCKAGKEGQVKWWRWIVDGQREEGRCSTNRLVLLRQNKKPAGPTCLLVSVLLRSDCRRCFCPLEFIL